VHRWYHIYIRLLWHRNWIWFCFYNFSGFIR